MNRDWSKVGRKKPRGKGESNPVGKTAARARTLTRNTGIVHYACKTRGGVWRIERWKDSRTWPDLSPPDELG